MVFDDCYLCNWIVEGRGRVMWCGAGRPEFDDGNLCPTRSEKVELIVSHREHPEIVSWKIIKPFVLPEVTVWLAHHMPDTKIENFDGGREHEILFTFSSAAKAIHFKMKWF